MRSLVRRSLFASAMGVLLASGCGMRGTRPVPADGAAGPLDPAEPGRALPLAPSAPTPSGASPSPALPSPAFPSRALPSPSPAAPAAPHVSPTPSVPPTAPLVAPASAPAPAPEPRTLVEWIDRLRRDAASGADPALSAHVPLLDALASHLPAPTAETTIVRVPTLEAAGLARPGAGLGFATITSYVEAGGDAAAVREGYLDFDRVPEFTGKPGTRTVSREGDAVVAKADAIRRALGFEYGARWSFRARRVDRGAARLLVTTQVEAEDTAHMLFTQGLFIAVPEAGGLRVVEIASSVMDYTVPAMLKGVAEQAVRKDMLARTNGLRAHWREYVR